MSNYDLQLLSAQRAFLHYDTAQIAQTFALEQDSAFLYVPFLAQRHRIDRKTALVEREEHGIWEPAGFHTGMTLFDMLTNADGRPVLSGIWCAHGTLNAVQAGTLRRNLSVDAEAAALAAPFAGRLPLLREVCAVLGGKPLPGGDFSCLLPLFPWFPVLLRFYDADEEFPAQLQLLWDRRTTRYLRYETTFFTSQAIIDRLTALLRAM